MQRLVWRLNGKLSGMKPRVVLVCKYLSDGRIWYVYSNIEILSHKDIILTHFPKKGGLNPLMISPWQKVQFPTSSIPSFCRKLLVGKRLGKNLKLKSISLELFVYVANVSPIDFFVT